MWRARKTFLVPVACGLLLWGALFSAGSPIVRANDDGGNGAYINLIVREVKVTPIRAHVGDVIRVDIVIEDQSDVRYAKGDLDLKANGRIVASKRYDYDFGGEGDRIYRSTLQWDTRDAKPGEYRIRAEFHVWGDASEFDNFLDTTEPLKLLPAGAAFPKGEEEGGTGVGRDPRYKPSAGAQEGNAVPSVKAGNY